MMGAGRGVFAGIASALVSTGIAAQQKPAVQPAQLQVSLAEAVRRALDVLPEMVQARGAVRNAGASGRTAWGAFLPTVTTSASGPGYTVVMWSVLSHRTTYGGEPSAERTSVISPR